MSAGSPFDDTNDGTTCSTGTSECYTACKNQDTAGAACIGYLASDCTTACCEDGQYDGITALAGTPSPPSTCTTAAADYWGGNTEKLNTFDNTLQYCGYNRDTGEAQVLGDPHFFGFDGTPFFFDGKDDAVFSLISEPDHQINALFGSVGPSHGVDSTIWMLGFGVRVRDELALAVHIDAAPEDIKLFRDERAKHGTKMRVKMPERKFLHIELNGRHADELLHSGRVLRLSKDALVYFPPATAINPNDATDGATRGWAAGAGGRGGVYKSRHAYSRR